MIRLMKRAYYSDSIEHFLKSDPNAILGELARQSQFAIELTQRSAWETQIDILKDSLVGLPGNVYFEYAIPRMGSRIDTVLLIGSVVFVLEFKVGEETYPAHAVDQVWDYALDLKNFHETTHPLCVAPVLIATKAPPREITVGTTAHNDNVLCPIKCNTATLRQALQKVLIHVHEQPIDAQQWEEGRYCPTPSILEAALALYRGHNVAEISRNDAGAKNLRETTDAISQIISDTKRHQRKAICFVTGVPGAGKTLVGLNIATKHLDAANDLYSVFLSGNGPLVQVLQEALARDQIQRAKKHQKKLTKKTAHSEVKAFVQNVHHYRDECLRDSKNPPADHVALFDEAQRAWDRQQTSSFMRRKKNQPEFNESEPEFLISCVDRHPDWGMVICLVGGGQEINTGEAGISEWIEALNRRFPDWHVHISDRLTDSEYGAGAVLQQLQARPHVFYHSDLHLSVSMRSFRAEHVSQLVKEILDHETDAARRTFEKLKTKYPIVLTRDVTKAKAWLRKQARGSERFGLVVSSSAERLRPYAIHVKAPINPIHWFLAGKEDVRSSYYLEDVATEFSIQGLELDWTCVTWDGDLRYKQDQWGHYSFKGQRWERVHKPERQQYLENAYRVLLTRARQGMIIVVPQGDPADPTRSPAFYDPTFAYLQRIGFPVI